jgi:Macrocin-O-methyltransferase (TylF)
MTAKSEEDRIWDAYNRFFHFCDSERFNKLLARHQLFLKTRRLPGHIFDCGVFKGSSTLGWAHMLECHSPHALKKVVGFDLFEKRMIDYLPSEKAEVERMMSEHMDRETDYFSFLNNVIRSKGLEKVCELVKGDVCETLPRYLDEHRGIRISLLHLDVDIYKPTLAILRAAFDLIVPGGLIVFDEYSYEGFAESDAVDEFMRERGLRERLRLRVVEGTHTPTAYLRV